jgi:tRNA(adenine34) deaminase
MQDRMNPETISENDIRFMTKALDLARTALADGEFPVGCVIADGHKVVAQGYRTGTIVGSQNEIDHAEINTLRRLSRDMPDIERSRLTLYGTMEPCLMCFSAILLSGIGRIVYAYEDVMGGGTGCDRSGLPLLYRNAQLTVISGVLRTNSLSLFQQFFIDSGNPYWADSLLSRYTLDQPVSE